MVTKPIVFYFFDAVIETMNKEGQLELSQDSLIEAERNYHVFRDFKA